MKMMCPVIVVADMAKSRQFYETVLSQDQFEQFEDGNVIYNGNLALHTLDAWEKSTGLKAADLCFKNNTEVLYFEVGDFDDFLSRLSRQPNIDYLNELVNFPWHQRGVRFYDPDGHLVEVSECMRSVAKRLLEEGRTIEEVVAATKQPLDLITSCASELGLAQLEDEAPLEGSLK